MIDLLIKNGLIITMDPKRRISKDGAMAIEEGKIIALDKTEKLIKDYQNAKEVLNAKNMLVLPGLIDMHVHLAQAMIRGCADDLALIPWLVERVWPLQGNYTHEDGKTSASLCILEMLKSGTTTFLECMLHTRYGFDGIAEVVKESGIRGVLAKTVMDMPGYASEKNVMHEGMIESKEASIKEALNMFKKWNGKANGRIHVWFGPRTPGACTPELYREVSELAKQLNTGITIHLAEVKEDVEYTKKEFNMLPFEFAESVGIAGSNVVLAHAVWLTQEEIDKIAKTKTNVCHCPSSNMKCGSGIAKIHEMLKSGINVALGCDGGPSNNAYDMVREMKLAALLQKVGKLDPEVLPAEQVLEMATINGAKALGLENEIGSIEPGKKADIIMIDLKKPHLTPCFNPISNLVYAAQGSDVDTVIIDGKVVMRKRRVLTMDEKKILKEAEKKGLDLIQKTKLHEKIVPKWPIQ
ncbi:MAG: amidohydrolase [Candidatus Bathyarchaeia archaeon]